MEVNLHELDNHKKEKLADKLMIEGSYYNAIDYYREILKTDTTRHDIEVKIADSYFFSRDYIDAEPFYAHYVQNNPKVKNLSRFNYGECLRYNQKYKEAKRQYALFKRTKYVGRDARIKKKLATAHARSCSYSLKSIEKPIYVYQTNLGDSVNSGYSDFSPLKINDSSLVFASLRSDTILHVHPGTSEFYPVHIYESRILDDGNWGDPEMVETVINKDFLHTANPAITGDKQTMFFTYCKPHHSEVRCHIYRRDWLEHEKTWAFDRKLHHHINKARYTSTMPTTGFYLKKKGKNIMKYNVLYFVSNRKGGRGGLDIWYSIENKRGNLTRPRNAGKAINTLGDEISPYYNQKEKTLYFSSNYHPNFGGYDMFKTKGHTRKFKRPKNLGFGINGSLDDTYYSTDSTGTEGYFVSNRPGGHVMMSETCCDDIYFYDYKKLFEFELIGKVYDEADAAKTALNNSLVHLYVRRDNKPDTILQTASIPEQGDLQYRFKISPNHEYYLKGIKTDYSGDSVVFSTFQAKLPDQIEINVPLNLPKSDTTPLIAIVDSESEKEISAAITELNTESEKQVSNTITELDSESKKEIKEKITEVEPAPKPTIKVLNSESSKELFVKVTEEIKPDPIGDEPVISQLNSESKKELSEVDTLDQLTAEQQKLVEAKIRGLYSSEKKKVVVTIVEEEAENKKKEQEVRNIGITSSESQKEIVEKKLEEVKPDEETPEHNFKVDDIIQIVYHGFDKGEHTNQEKATTEFVIAVMKKYRNMNLRVESHTDSKGSMSYNDMLSARRAKSVKSHLIQQGIEKERITSLSFGERKPVAPNTLPNGADNPKGRALNRRTEFRITKLK